MLDVKSWGVEINGDLGLDDNRKLALGNLPDFEMYHGGVNTHINNITGSLRFEYQGTLKAQITDTRLQLRDNVNLSLGSSNDFNFYHDTSSNRIISNAFDLIVQSNGYSIRSENGSSTFATIDSSGETRLLAGADGTNKSTIELRNGSSSGTTNRLLYGLHSATTTSNGTGIYSIFTNGTVGTPSDIRLKKNVETTRDGYLSDLANLRVVKYHWKTQEDTEPKELGLIAQEVEKIFPGLIHTEGEGSDEVKEIKRSVLPFMLLKALQEAIVKIETLETKVAALEGG